MFDSHLLQVPYEIKTERSNWSPCRFDVASTAKWGMIVYYLDRGLENESDGFWISTCRVVYSHLCILVAVSSRVFQVLAGAFIAVGVEIDGAGCSLCQELRPNVLCPLCNILLGHPFQVLHGQPEPRKAEVVYIMIRGLSVLKSLPHTSYYLSVRWRDWLKTYCEHESFILLGFKILYFLKVAQNL